MNLEHNSVEYKVKVDYEYKLTESVSVMKPRQTSHLPYIEPARRKLVIEKFKEIDEEISKDLSEKE